jgi:diguanylate cyclase (GGDEF)-like protein
MHNPTQASTSSKWFGFGIRGKIAAILFATLLVTLTVNTLLAMNAQEQDIRAETDRRGHETAHFIAQYLSYSVVRYDYHALELLLQDLTRRHDIVYARVDSARENVMAVAGRQPGSSEQIHSYTEEIRLNGELLGKLTLSLSSERTAQIMAMRQRELMFGQMLAVVVVLIAGFIALSRFIIHPLTIITQTLRQNHRSNENRLERIPLHADDEIGELAHGFNSLSDRLDEARQKLETRIQAADKELQEAYQRLEQQAQELRKMNRDLEQQNITDLVTGLYNRRYFEILMATEVEHSIRSDETISILLVDIDNFQTIIERLGHDSADEVMRSVAAIIAERTRRSDVACRYGGSEFVLLCRRATIANAIAIADDLQRTLVDHPLIIRGQEENISVSIGVATNPGVLRLTNAAEFFRCADDALRSSRQTGRGGVVHFSMVDHNAHTAVQ